tara:strand:+ start:69 stop:242 length:174 start_codon:yes stop_codon:yes gene_type:complete
MSYIGIEVPIPVTTSTAFSLVRCVYKIVKSANIFKLDYLYRSVGSNFDKIAAFPDTI